MSIITVNCCMKLSLRKMFKVFTLSLNALLDSKWKWECCILWGYLDVVNMLRSMFCDHCNVQVEEAAQFCWGLSHKELHAATKHRATLEARLHQRPSNWETGPHSDEGSHRSTQEESSRFLVSDTAFSSLLRPSFQLSDEGKEQGMHLMWTMIWCETHGLSFGAFIVQHLPNNVKKLCHQ